MAMKNAAMLSGVLVLALLGAAQAAQAAQGAQGKECKGVAFPEHLQVSGSDLTLNGLGMRKATFLKVNVYVGALYVAHPSRDPQPLIDPASPAELILHFVRNVGVGDLRDAWKEGFEKVAKDQLPALNARIATLNSWMSGMETGQRLTFTRLPGTGIQVDVNGAVKGTIPGDDFARALMTIWLGPNPPNSELKSGLLGGSCD
jgi:Chalcone isomerase-like